MKTVLISIIFSILMLSCDNHLLQDHDQKHCISNDNFERLLTANKAVEEDVILSCYHFKDSSIEEYAEGTVVMNQYVSSLEPTVEELSDFDIFGFGRSKEIGRNLNMIIYSSSNRNKYLSMKNMILGLAKNTREVNGKEYDYELEFRDGVKYKLSFQKDTDNKYTNYMLMMIPSGYVD